MKNKKLNIALWCIVIAITAGMIGCIICGVIRRNQEKPPEDTASTETTAPLVTKPDESNRPP